MADVDIADLEKQYEEIGVMIEKLGGKKKDPKSQGADMTAAGKHNIKVPPVKNHDQKVKKTEDDEQVLKAKKKPPPQDEEDAADGGDDEDTEDMGKMAKAKKSPNNGDQEDPEDAADGGADDWSEDADGKKKGVKKMRDESFEFEGKTIRKSAVGTQFDLMKAMAEQIEESRDDIAKARDDAMLARLEKRADAEFAHIPGTTQDRAQMLKFIDKMPEAVKKSFERLMTSHEKLAGTAFGKIGVSGGDSEDLRKARGDFEGKVGEIKKRDNCTRTEAMSKARTEFPDLFKAYQDASIN